MDGEDKGKDKSHKSLKSVPKYDIMCFGNDFLKGLTSHYKIYCSRSGRHSFKQLSRASRWIF